MKETDQVYRDIAEIKERLEKVKWFLELSEMRYRFGYVASRELDAATKEELDSLLEGKAGIEKLKLYYQMKLKADYCYTQLDTLGRAFASGEMERVEGKYFEKGEER